MGSLKVRGTHPSPHVPPRPRSPVTAPPLSRADPVRGQQAARAGGCVQGARDLPRALHRQSPVKVVQLQSGLSEKVLARLSRPSRSLPFLARGAIGWQRSSSASSSPSDLGDVSSPSHPSAANRN